ncbi:VWA domain-containing protein [Zeaxanthinibacter sp. PT1]|uniref:VWA domain-containing protein n=1 Tax=Zeaxanthinibacter TaxID=561554 RepID=UPI00234944B2|nr:VWA domain-containing protein [Zeaxanthinibacter sp. PT1]MDC6350865.1 VWA domain-containing protein [Zeaxanthinibacter sp. PT1]
MVQFDETSYFYLLLVIPVLVLVYIGVQFWKKRTRQKFGDLDLLRRLAPDTSRFKPLLKFLVFIIGLGFLILGLVNPKIGTQLETVKREGVDIVFAVDVSRSMLAEDIAPNRLEKSKRLVSEIINSLGSDRVGIIAYAGQAYPQLPITTDYGAAKMFLQSMNTDMLSSQGTAIHEAIELATTYFDNEQQTNRVLFIVSDGEDHGDGYPATAVEQAMENGIRVFTIGVGTEKGGPIPLKRKGVVQQLKKDENGEVVITKLDRALLEEIAQQGEGSYIDGTDTEEAVKKIAEALQQMDKTEFEAKQFAKFKDQFQWFLAAALFFLFLDIFLLERKTEWLRKLNLFNEKKVE